MRGLRSFSQGFLNVVTPLYLISLGLSVTNLGLVYTASLLFAAILLVPVGVMADRRGRRPFLFAFTILMAIWGTIYAFSSALPALLAVSAVAGIGRGGGSVGGGQAGPFAPAEQALLADLAPDDRRQDVFAWNAFIAAALAAAGTAISGLPSWLKGWHSSFLASDRLLFTITIVMAVVSMLLLLLVREPPLTPRPAGSGIMSKPSARLVVQQSIAAVFQSSGLGLVTSLFVVWLNLRFHVGAATIGPVLAVSYILSAGSFFIASAIAKHVGSVRTIVATRLLAVVFAIAIGFAPTFLVAMALYVLRSIASTMIMPVRQAFTMGLFPASERASAVSFSGLVRRLSAAVSPTGAGALMDTGLLGLPFVCGGILQAVSAVLYWKFFSPLDDVSPPKLDGDTVLEEESL